MSILLVITISLLTALTWQTYDMYAEYGRLNTKVATILVNDITNRMYLNHQGSIKDYPNFYIDQINAAKKNLIEQHVNSLCYTETDGCLPNIIAANDIIYWHQAIRDNLPNGIGEIKVDPNNPYSYIVNIRWDGSYNRQQLVTANIVFPYTSP